MEHVVIYIRELVDKIEETEQNKEFLSEIRKATYRLNLLIYEHHMWLIKLMEDYIRKDEKK